MFRDDISAYEIIILDSSGSPVVFENVSKAVTEIPSGRITIGPAYKARLSLGCVGGDVIAAAVSH